MENTHLLQEQSRALEVWRQVNQRPDPALIEGWAECAADGDVVVYRYSDQEGSWPVQERLASFWLGAAADPPEPTRWTIRWESNDTTGTCYNLPREEAEAMRDKLADLYPSHRYSLEPLR